MQRSLRVRLLIGGAFAVFVALAVAWAAMSVLFERHLQRQVAADLIQGPLIEPRLRILTRPVAFVAESERGPRTIAPVRPGTRAAVP